MPALRRRERRRACIESPSMNLKRHFGEALTLAAAAALCALVANALARSERKLPLVGTYPNATKVPEKKTGEEISSAPVQNPPAVSSPADSGAKALSEVSSKVNGAGRPRRRPPRARRATAPAPKVTPTAAAAAKLPLEEKRPGQTTKSTGAAPVPSPAGEQKDSLLSRFPPHPDKPYVEISGDDVAWLVARGVLVVDARRTKDYAAGPRRGRAEHLALGGRRRREDHGARERGARRRGARRRLLLGRRLRGLSHALGRASTAAGSTTPRLQGRLARLGEARRQERERAGAGPP